MFEDPLSTTGHKYVNAYNAKSADYHERIMPAVSDDGEHWKRYGNRAAIDVRKFDPQNQICDEPLIKNKYEWEKYNAHKTWFVRYGGVNYHFYCACADNERFIALAVSD